MHSFVCIHIEQPSVSPCGCDSFGGMCGRGRGLHGALRGCALRVVRCERRQTSPSDATRERTPQLKIYVRKGYGVHSILDRELAYIAARQ